MGLGDLEMPLLRCLGLSPGKDWRYLFLGLDIAEAGQARLPYQLPGVKNI